MGVGPISPGLALCDEERRPRAFVGMFADGSPHLVLFDKQAKTLTAVRTHANGYHGLPFFSDAKGMPRAEVMLLADGSPELRLYDEKGNVIWQAP